MQISRTDFECERVHDESPDLSYLGEYSNKPATVHIDREETGDRGRNELRYFNAGCGDPNYIADDYKRFEDYNAGGWYMIGIRATVTLHIPTSLGGTIEQTIHSPGLWGIESDSDQSHIDEVYADECDQLAEMLTAMGITVTNEEET